MSFNAPPVNYFVVPRLASYCRLFEVSGVVGLEASLKDPQKVRGLMLVNVSLRMLHLKKQQWYVRPFVKALQNVLR